MNQAASQSPALWILIPILFAATATTMFFLVGHVLAALGGWKALAEHYRASEEPPGERFAWTSFRMGPINYNSCLTLIAGSGGLHLSIFPLLRSGHPPLMLPWREIKVTPHQGWLGHSLDLSASKAPDVRLRIRRGFAEKILRAAGQPVPA